MIGVHDKLDILLGGGLLPGTITHIYGTPASGKTTIALLASYNASKEGKVIYLDSEGGFSVERLQQIAGEEVENVLEKIMLIEPTEFDEQKVAIRKLSDIVANSKANLVIVDSISVLYRLEENRDIKELGRQLAQLLRIGRRHKIPVLITNQVYTDIETGRIVSVGGDIMRYWAKIILELENLGEERYAILRKHKFLPEGMRLKFRIVNKGIEVLETSFENLEGYEYGVKEG